MKSKTITIALALLTVVSIAYAYMQRMDAQFQRDKANEMHREVVKLRDESEAARTEAAKQRGLSEKLMEAKAQTDKELEECRKGKK